MEILIDSRSSGDFIHQRIIKKLSFKSIEIKSTPILGFNNKFMFDIYQKTPKTQLKIDEHEEEIEFRIIDKGNYNIILDQPWL